MDSDREKLKQKLEELQFFNQKILDNVPVSIAVADSQGNVILTNQFFLKLVPWYDPKKGLNFLESKRLKEAGLTNKYAQVLKTGIAFSQKGVLVKAPKPYYSFYVNFEVLPLKDDAGKIIGAISIGQEITSLMKAKDNLTKINQELDKEVKKRTEEFYEINNQMSEKIELYEKIFEFLVGHVKETLHYFDEVEKVPISEAGAKQYAKFKNIFKDFIYLNKIEKKELAPNLARVSLSQFLEKVFRGDNYKISIENMSMSEEVLMDTEMIEHVFLGIYNRFYDILEQANIKIDRKGSQLVVNMSFVIGQSSDFNGHNSNFFWDIQLLIYKELIHLHKGVLHEMIDNNTIDFEIRLLLAEN